jgi:Flp pilus assembly protein TadB
MITWLLKWITPVSTQIWLLVGTAFGALLLVVKAMGNKISKQKVENQNLESEVQKAERLQNVEVNTNRDDAIARLREHGQVRKD